MNREYESFSRGNRWTRDLARNVRGICMNNDRIISPASLSFFNNGKFEKSVTSDKRIYTKVRSLDGISL